MSSATIGPCRLILGDCLDVLSLVSPASLCLADPPYGIDLGRISGSRLSRWRALRNHQPAPSAGYAVTGDHEAFDPAPFLRFSQLILWGGNHFASRLPDARKWLIWDKRVGKTPNHGADAEMAWTNLPGPTRLYSHLWMGMCREGEENLSRGGRIVHPTQKPVAVMEWCIHQFGPLPDGSVLFDPFMGSGSAGVAAVRRGLRYVGVEIDPGHYQTACTRIFDAWRGVAA